MIQPQRAPYFYGPETEEGERQAGQDADEDDRGGDKGDGTEWR